jgi:hypothetical protein
MGRRTPSPGKGRNYQITPAGPEFVPDNLEQRKDDPAYKAYLKEGEKRRGTYTAKETGAHQMAVKGEIARIEAVQKELKRRKTERATERARKLT